MLRMKRLIFFAGLLAVSCGALRAEEGQVVDCHGTKLTILEDTKSPQERYAVGREVGGDLDLMGNYFVDLQRKECVELKTDRPYFPRENHAFLGVFYGKGWCLVQNQKRFATENLYLIKLGREKMEVADIMPRLEKAVRLLLEEKRPLYAKGMSISYPNSEWDDVYEQPVFYKDRIRIQFHADLPKSGYDQVSGWVTVSLPGGAVTKVECNAKRDNPYLDDPAVAKADKELNEVYGVLMKQLPPARAATLKKEQLAWIDGKDKGLQGNYPSVGDEVEPPVFTRERNKDLAETIRLRTEELKGMLRK